MFHIPAIGDQYVGNGADNYRISGCFLYTVAAIEHGIVTLTNPYVSDVTVSLLTLNYLLRHGYIEYSPYGEVA